MQKCLIVVDYQNDFVSGSLGFPGAEALDGPIARKIQEYRAAGDAVIFTFDTHGPDYLDTQEGKNLPVPHCLSGSDGHALYGETAQLKEDGDLCFYKPVFGSGELFDHLRSTPYAAIELVGLVSNICVMSNAVLAKTAQPETPITVDAACTASHDPALHTATLDVMVGLQIAVINR